MHTMLRIQSFIKQWHGTVGVLGLKKFCFTRFTFKTQLKIEILILFSVAEMTWNKPCIYRRFARIEI